MGTTSPGGKAAPSGGMLSRILGEVGTVAATLSAYAGYDLITPGPHAWWVSTAMAGFAAVSSAAYAASASLKARGY